MPNDETITSFADRLIDLAERVIEDNGGKREVEQQRCRLCHRVRVAPLCGRVAEPKRANRGDAQGVRQRTSSEGILQKRDTRTKARAAYLAICLDMSKRYQEQHNDRWQAGVAEH